MTPDLSTPPSTDPALILRYRDRQYAAELLAAAVAHIPLEALTDGTKKSVKTFSHIDGTDVHVDLQLRCKVQHLRHLGRSTVTQAVDLRDDGCNHF